ncbi:MAG: hypothetical protein R3F39_09045 [Myxococcota bacterium]
MYSASALLGVSAALVAALAVILHRGRGSSHRALLALLVLAGFAIALPDRETTAAHETNRFVRYASAEAWVRYGDWSIEDVLARTERGAELDLSFKDGRPYSQKPPGISWAAIPAYWVLSQLAPDGRPPTHWAIAMLSLLTILLPCLLIAHQLGRYLLARHGPRAALLALATLLLASPLCVYAMMFMGYARPTLLLVSAWLLLQTGDSRPRYAAAALLMGLAGIDNMVFWAYGAMVAAIDLARRVRTARPWRPLLPVGLLAVALPAAALLTYNTIVWGGPFTTAYAPAFLNADHAARHHAIGWSFATLREALVGARLGLFLHAPWAAIAQFGVAAMIARRATRFAGLTALAMVIAPLCFNAIWVGTNPDDAPFNRHMLPAYPWLALGLAHLAHLAETWAAARRHALFAALTATLAVATFYQFATVWTVPLHPTEVASPLWQFSLPLFVSGALMPVLDLDPSRTPGLRNLAVVAPWVWLHLAAVVAAYGLVVTARPEHPPAPAPRPPPLTRWAPLLIALATLALLAFQGLASDPLSSRQRELVTLAPAAVPAELRPAWRLARIEQRTFMAGAALSLGAWSARDDADYRPGCYPESPYRAVADCP